MTSQVVKISDKKYNRLKPFIIKALFYVLIFYLVSFRFCIIAQQLFLQDKKNSVGYFNVINSGKDAIVKVLEKIAPEEDSQLQKLAIVGSVYEDGFLKLDFFIEFLLFLVFAFYFKGQLKILSPPSLYFCRAPPIC